MTKLFVLFMYVHTEHMQEIIKDIDEYKGTAYFIRILFKIRLDRSGHLLNLAFLSCHGQTNNDIKSFFYEVPTSLHLINKSTVASISLNAKNWKIIG